MLRSHSPEWIQIQGDSTTSLQIEGKIIKAMGAKSKIVSTVPLKGKFRITISCNRIRSLIALGIIDQSQINDIESENPNLLYYQNYGEFWQNGELKAKSKVVRQKDFLTVSGDMKTGRISFEINSVPVLNLTCRFILNAKTQWVAYLYLWKGSSVTIIENFYQISMIPVHLAEKWFKWDRDLIRQIHFLLEDVQSLQNQQAQ